MDADADYDLFDTIPTTFARQLLDNRPSISSINNENHQYNNDVIPPPEVPVPESDDWEEDPSADDAHTTVQADELYELNRWAAWTKSPQLITHEMFNSSNWNLNVDIPGANLSDEEFFQLDKAEFAYDSERLELYESEYWRRRDRDWCFACCYSISTEQRRSNPDFAIVAEMLENGFHSRTLNKVCSEIQDAWTRNVRPRLQAETDPTTNTLRPRRYWHRRTIREHLLHHVPSVRVDIEQTMRTLTELENKCRRVIFRRNRVTGELKMNSAALNSTLKVMNEKQKLYKYLETIRKASKKRTREDY